MPTYFLLEYQEVEETQLSLEDLRLSPEARANIERSQKKTRKSRSISSAPFVRGPIPEWWITRAAKLPGKSLHMALALWAVHHCDRDKLVRINRKLLDRFGLQRHSAYRALEHLESARLVQCDRAPGRFATVRLLLDPPNNAPVGNSE